jgi:pimeloyl-ACP methyl ester carboxylesterase
VKPIRVSIDGEELHLLTCGPPSGPLALCLHGFPDLPTTWAPVMQRLAAAGIRSAAPYMRGYFPSTLRGPFHAERLARDAVALADALSPGTPVHLCGHDWGAIATQASIALAPARFRSAITIAVPHVAQLLTNLPRHPAQLARSAYIAFFQLPVLPPLAIARLDLIERLWRCWSPGFEPPSGHLDAIRDVIDRSALAPLAYYRALPHTLARSVPSWRALRVSTLHIHGSRDGCIAPALASGQSRFFAAEHQTELVAAGHFAPLEVPDRVAELAVRWIRAHSK